MKFETKANTLEKLFGNLKHGVVLPQVSFTVRDWKSSDYLDILFESNIEPRLSTFV